MKKGKVNMGFRVG